MDRTLGSETEYVPLAERIRRVNEQTPDRFRRDPVLRESNHAKWAQRRKATKAQSPSFATDARSRRLREAREQNKTSKAPKQRERKLSGAPNLRTSQRAKHNAPLEPEKFNTQFKARPAPSSTHRPHASANTSRASSFCSTGTTEQVPFSFDSRPSKKKEITVPKPEMKLHHAPGALPETNDRAGALPERSTLKTTKPQPFSFASSMRSQQKMFTFGSASTTMMEFGAGTNTTKKSNEKFMKQALRGHESVIPERKTATVPKSPTLSLKSRGESRREFDEELRKKMEAEEEQKRVEAEERRINEENEDAERRKKLVHKANPIRTDYVPVPEKRTALPTLPITPKYAGPKTRSRVKK